MKLCLVVVPEDSDGDSFVVNLNDVDEIRHRLRPGSEVYLLSAFPDPMVPPGVIAVAEELGRFKPYGRLLEVIR
jgi:hypothetical protein